MPRLTAQPNKKRILNFWAGEDIQRLLDSAVKATDTDRAKFIRNAIREKAERSGISMTEHARN